jgi:Tol biopolymer transport system component
MLMRRVLFLLGVVGLAACGTEPSPPPPPFAGKIVFQSDRATLDGSPLLYSMNPDGSEIRQVPISLPSALGQADISPDGERIVLSQGFALYTSRGDGTELRLVVPAGKGASKPAWSPDGQRLAFAAQQAGIYDIWVSDQLGNGQTDLTQTPDYAEGAPAWAPDGMRLIYSRGLPDGSIPFELWTMKADGTDPRRLIGDPHNDAANPAFSPDGTWIAYVSGPGIFNDLRVARADGTEDHSIFKLDDGTALDDPAWSPDGQEIVFSLSLNIATIHVDGTGLQVLTDSAINFDPDWGPAPPP